MTLGIDRALVSQGREVLFQHQSDPAFLAKLQVFRGSIGKEIHRINDQLSHNSVGYYDFQFHEFRRFAYNNEPAISPKTLPLIMKDFAGHCISTGDLGLQKSDHAAVQEFIIHKLSLHTKPSNIQLGRVDKFFDKVLKRAVKSQQQKNAEQQVRENEALEETLTEKYKDLKSETERHLGFHIISDFGIIIDNAIDELNDYEPFTDAIRALRDAAVDIKANGYSQYKSYGITTKVLANLPSKTGYRDLDLLIKVIKERPTQADLQQFQQQLPTELQSLITQLTSLNPNHPLLQDLQQDILLKPYLNKINAFPAPSTPPSFHSLPPIHAQGVSAGAAAPASLQGRVRASCCSRLCNWLSSCLKCITLALKNLCSC